MFYELTKDAEEYLELMPENYVTEENAICSEFVGMKIWEKPVFGVADASDSLFKALKDPKVIHPDVTDPYDWVKDARSVISFFLPFSDRIKNANATFRNSVAPEWVQGCSAGQLALNQLSIHICKFLEERGYDAVAPSIDPRFKMIAPRIACWSERHTAYICGLGTFSMSRGLITEKGMAGRFGSIVTNVVLPVRKREYSSLFEYCNHCGKCAINCPAGAIDVSKDIEDAKDNQVCTEFITEVCRPYQREGGPHHHCCGKCQVNVPCQNGIPHR